MGRPESDYLYLDYTLQHGGLVNEPKLAAFSERHKIAIQAPQLADVADALAWLRENDARGLVIALQVGWPGLPHLSLAQKARKAGYATYLYWPEEEAVDVLDKDRHRSCLKLWWALKGMHVLHKVLMAWKWTKAWTLRLAKATYRALAAMKKSLKADLLKRQPPQETFDSSEYASAKLAFLERLAEGAAPATFSGDAGVPDPSAPSDGVGVYLRTDFWAAISSGGSYGHTCYVAKELAKAQKDFVCFMAHGYDLLDEMGLNQVVLPPPGELGTEENIIQADEHYHALLRPALMALRPRYLYERTCLGNTAAAQLCKELGIPYIVEYNGSEISIKKSFDSQGYVFEDIYLMAEEAIFRQATAINVVSKWVRKDLVDRGFDQDKVLVNPNGVDPEAYAPASPDQKLALKAEFGWDDSHCVIGFIGTFGGWHGIDVLAEALAPICAQAPNARFLLIGDGNFKHLVDAAIKQHKLKKFVHCTGRVPQTEGARLLGACDIFVSPHSSHMVDSKFFGSPTKLFEYMSMGAGVVASDLEQIGEVLSPALHASILDADTPPVTDERSVLCSPGDVDEFVKGVVYLAGRPEVSAALGRNARQAVLDHYTWERHVDRLWRFLRGEKDVRPEKGKRITRPAAKPAPGRYSQAPMLETGDEYKKQAQMQWDNDPCGSHYVKGAELHSLAWYLEAEQYRYDDYAPWMPRLMEFDGHAGSTVLEIGAGMGTDLSRFARGGAQVTDFDLSQGHLALAQENFALRGLAGEFFHGDAEHLPFDDNSFDVVYSNGVIHHIPDTQRVINEILRVLKPGGKAIVMVYAENSKHYWRNLVWDEGVAKGMLYTSSMHDIMSRLVEISEEDARPLVKVYTSSRLRKMFGQFDGVQVFKRQLTQPELPKLLSRMPLGMAGRLMGWNLIVKARKPRG